MIRTTGTGRRRRRGTAWRGGAARCFPAKCRARRGASRCRRRARAVEQRRAGYNSRRVAAASAAFGGRQRRDRQAEGRRADAARDIGDVGDDRRGGRLAARARARPGSAHARRRRRSSPHW